MLATAVVSASDRVETSRPCSRTRRWVANIVCSSASSISPAVSASRTRDRKSSSVHSLSRRRARSAANVSQALVESSLERSLNRRRTSAWASENEAAVSPCASCARTSRRRVRSISRESSRAMLRVVGEVVSSSLTNLRTSREACLTSARRRSSCCWTVSLEC